jgi:CheY-like chemotaxis protein
MSPAGKRVLVVDDDADIREIEQLLLEENGYRVQTAADGAKALKALDPADPPDVILLDLMMPIMNGEQFLKAIEGSPWARVPVILVSGHRSVQEKLQELHAAAWLPKPVDLDLFLDTLEQVAGKPSPPGTSLS